MLVGLGFRRGLRFGLGQLKVDAWLAVVEVGEWVRCIGDVGYVCDDAGDGRDGGSLVLLQVDRQTDIILQSGVVNVSTAGRFEGVCWSPQFLRNLVSLVFVWIACVLEQSGAEMDG